MIMMMIMMIMKVMFDMMCPIPNSDSDCPYPISKISVIPYPVSCLVLSVLVNLKKKGSKKSKKSPKYLSLIVVITISKDYRPTQSDRCRKKVISGRVKSSHVRDLETESPSAVVMVIASAVWERKASRQISMMQRQ